MKKKESFEITYIDLLCTIALAIVFLCNAFLIEMTFINMKTALEIQVLLVYTLILLLFIFRNGIFELKSLFWITFGLFSFGNILVFYMGGEDYTKYLGSFGSFTWNNEIVVKTLFYYLTFMIVFFIFSIKKETITLENKNLYSSYIDKSSFLKIGSFLMLVSLPFALYVSLVELKAALTLGYESVYIVTTSVSPIFRLFRLTFTAGFFAVCAGSTNEKQFIKYGYIFLFYQLVSALKGNRMGIVVALLFVFYFRYKMFGKKVKLRYIFAAFFLGIPTLSFMVYLRSGSALAFKFVDLYRSFLQQSGSSINIVAMYQQNIAELSSNSYPYIFEPLLRFFLILKYPFLASSGQSEAVLSVRYNLAHQLSGYMDKITYLSGGGLGSSFVAELSEFGIIGIIIGAILLALAIRWINKKMITSNVMRFFSFIIISHILIMPRAEYFLDTYTLLKYLLTYFCLYIFIKIISIKFYECKLDN